MLYSIWLGAVISHPWLPHAQGRHGWGLTAQILALTVLSTGVGMLGHRFGGPNIFFSPYNLQVQLILCTCACLALEYHQRGRRREADAESLHRGEQEQARQLDAARAQRCCRPRSSRISCSTRWPTCAGWPAPMRPPRAPCSPTCADTSPLPCPICAKPRHRWCANWSW